MSLLGWVGKLIWNPSQTLTQLGERFKLSFIRRWVHQKENIPEEWSRWSVSEYGAYPKQDKKVLEN